MLEYQSTITDSNAMSFAIRDVRRREDLRVELPKVSIQVRTVRCSDGTILPGWDKSLEARKSYNVYGAVPLSDPYDAKSTVYVAEAAYKTGPGVLDNDFECITMRLVPANGKFREPYSTEDIDLFTFSTADQKDRISTIKVLEEKGIELSRVATISRLGTIAPASSNNNAYLAESFAVVQLQAVNDARRLGIDWIICQLHPSLQARSLAVEEKQLDFRPAAEQLNLQRQGEFVLNRWDDAVWNYMLQYPGYFIEMQSLKDSLKRTIGRRTNAILREYGIENLQSLSWRNVKNLADMFNDSPNRVLVKARNVTVGDLRENMRAEVKDAVFLALMNVDKWEQSAQNLLEYSWNQQTKSLSL